MSIFRKLAGIRLSIATRLAAAGVLIVIVAVMASVMVSVDTAEKGMRGRAQASLDVDMNVLRDIASATGGPRRDGDNLYFGGRPVNGEMSIVDKVKQLAGCTATIFMGDLRVTTNVTKPDGSRAIGTRLARGPAYDSIFVDHKTYRGEADILGTPYFTIYEPILDQTSKSVIGIFFVGIKQSEFLAVAGAMITGNVIAGGVIALLAAMLMLAVVKVMMRPLRPIREAMHRLAAGYHDIDISTKPQAPEIADMTRAVLALREANRAKARGEADNAEHRASAEAARRRGEQESAARAETQKHVVQAIAAGLENLSAGDLTYRIAENFSPEYAGLKDDFNTAISQLQRLMRVVAANVDCIRDGSGDMLDAANDLARRTQSQAAHLAETAAAVNAIGQTMRQTTDSAKSASDIVSRTKADSNQSSTVVGDAVSAMAEIETSAQAISQITGVIDEIAFQTNLLALNAGVEAARAGDAGKGFAVVAAEVRALAQRSAGAAKEIKALIQASRGQVNRGVDLVAQTGKALDRIALSVVDIHAVVSGMAGSADTQMSVLRNVTNAIGAMDQVTSQNVSMARQSTDASRTLADEAEDLAALVAHFRTGGREGDGRPARRAA